MLADDWECSLSAVVRDSILRFFRRVSSPREAVVARIFATSALPTGRVGRRETAWGEIFREDFEMASSMISFRTTFWWPGTKQRESEMWGNLDKIVFIAARVLYSRVSSFFLDLSFSSELCESVTSTMSSITSREMM